MPFLSMWDKQGHLIRTWDISATNSTPTGITTDRKYLWLMNSGDNQIEQRDKQSHLIEQVGITLASDSRGSITTDRKYMWYCDITNGVVVLVDKQGHEIRTFATTHDPYGITTDRKYLWVTENNKGVAWHLRQYDKQGHLISSTNLSTQVENIEAYGITTDRKYLWITDAGNSQVHQFDKQGHLIESWACAPEQEVPIGITTDRKYLWITSYTLCVWCEEETLYERYIVNDDFSYPIRGTTFMGQTFTIGNTGANVNHHLCSLKLKLYKVGAPVGNMTVEVQNVNGANKPDNVSISTGTYDVATLGAAPGAWVTITMSDVELVAGTQYAIVCKYAAGDLSDYVKWRADISGSTYGGGKLHTTNDSGTTWTPGDEKDFMFEEYGDARCY